MKKIILRALILLLIVILGYESYSYVKDLSISNKPSEVNIKEIIKSNDKSIAIWVQDEEGTDNWHEATNRDSWPSPTTHGYVGAECTDSEGAEVEASSVITFDLNTYTATINTKNTIYCTLYFAKGMPALQKLKETGGSVFAEGGEHTTAVDGMYRYKGTTTAVNNNYICFGTSDKEECLGTPKTYMYRIIGITSADNSTLGLQKDQLKIIKATTSSDSQVWNSNYSSNVPWDSTDIKNYLNGTFYNTIKNATPNGTYWDSIITSHSWYNADYTSVPNAEPTTSHTSNSKIGLMYATDYKNSGDQNTNNWLHLKNGWTGNSTSLNEWTMSRYGYWSNGDVYPAWFVGSSGYFNFGNVDYTRAVRPVFYLQSAINLTGAGTATDPFRITTKNNA